TAPRSAVSEENNHHSIINIAWQETTITRRAATVPDQAVALMTPQARSVRTGTVNAHRCVGR
ncbi:MAG: hypothetical protein ACPL8I_00925, partial [Chloroflexaceae bacterium]